MSIAISIMILIKINRNGQSINLLNLAWTVIAKYLVPFVFFKNGNSNPHCIEMLFFLQCNVLAHSLIKISTYIILIC